MKELEFLYRYEKSWLGRCVSDVVCCCKEAEKDFGRRFSFEE